MLLVDVGNSRVKWAECRDGRLSPQRAAEHALWLPEDWRRELLATPGLRRVVAASVAGGAPLEALAAAARAAGCEFERVTTSAAAAGVRNGYPDPRLLGVDRWLAAIAAHHLAGRACCVFDVGTAATIDTVRADGQHLGGFILPGPALMVSSLLSGTRDLAAHSSASGEAGRTFFADNTRDAIVRGARVALAALADRATDELARLDGGPAQLIVSGGAAAEVLPYLQSPARHEPDLVLQGLARLAGA